MSAAATERFAELADLPDHSAELAELVGQEAGAPSMSWDAVNVPMIRHWVEAMGDENPVYLSDEAARAAGYDQLIAPPTMLQAWIMRGLKASNEVEAARASGTSQGEGSSDRMMKLLDDEGLTSVVATNCEQTYGRPLVVGDRLLVRSMIESISEPKRTGLGIGRFLTTLQEYVAVPDASVPAGVGGGAGASGGGGGPGGLSGEQMRALFDAGERVATMRFRILKFLPPDRKAPRPPRPHPALTQDNAFWFDGARAHRLLIQHCTVVRHAAPPTPAGLRRLRLLGVGHRRVQRPRHPVLLRRRALPAGAVLRVPLADRPDRARGGDARRRQPGQRRARRHHDRHAGAGRVRRLRRGAVAAGLRAGRRRCRRRHGEGN